MLWLKWGKDTNEVKEMQFFSTLPICLKDIRRRGNLDLFIFLPSFFYPHTLISQQHSVSTLYILCVLKGKCVLLVYTVYIKDITGGWNNCGFLWETNHKHFWCICKTTMYVQYACKCRCSGVAKVHSTRLRSALPLFSFPCLLNPTESWRSLLIVNNVETITNI